MKTNKREVYLAPQCLIVQMSEATYLMDTSFPSQHRPANPGGTISSAKASMPCAGQHYAHSPQSSGTPYVRCKYIPFQSQDYSVLIGHI